MGNTGSSLTDLSLFSKGGIFTRDQIDEYQVTYQYSSGYIIII